jgi:tRNA pseudouridine-54 N-methylase
LEIRGDKVRGINPDERAIAGVLKKVFQGTKYTGIRFYEESLENLIKKENPIMLGTKGEYSISKIQTQNTFLLGDQLGFQEDIYILLSNLEKYSLGSNIYLSSQAITIINYLLDQNS